MLWRNCQGVDSQRLASTYVYCSENLSDLGDKKKERQKEKRGKGQRRKKDRKEHQCKKGQL